MQLTKEILLHLKPVKDLFEFKTRSIRHITRVLYHICWESNMMEHIIGDLKSTKELRMWCLLNYMSYVHTWCCASCLTCSHAPFASCFTCSRVSRASYPTFSRSLVCALSPPYSLASRTSYLTCSNVNHYDAS